MTKDELKARLAKLSEDDRKLLKEIFSEGSGGGSDLAQTVLEMQKDLKELKDFVEVGKKKKGKSFLDELFAEV